jgi:hypothetical protein
MTQPTPPPLPPPPLDYGHADPSRGPRRSWAKFTSGIGAGLVISLFYYLTLGTNVAQVTPFAPFGAVIGKLAAGIALLFYPRWKDFGIGLIASIPVAVLIFLGLCFAAVSKL